MVSVSADSAWFMKPRALILLRKCGKERIYRTILHKSGFAWELSSDGTIQSVILHALYHNINSENRRSCVLRT